MKYINAKSEIAFLQRLDSSLIFSLNLNKKALSNTLEDHIFTIQNMDNCHTNCADFENGLNLGTNLAMKKIRSEYNKDRGKRK